VNQNRASNVLRKESNRYALREFPRLVDVAATPPVQPKSAASKRWHPAYPALSFFYCSCSSKLRPGAEIQAEITADA